MEVWIFYSDSWYVGPRSNSCCCSKYQCTMQPDKHSAREKWLSPDHQPDKSSEETLLDHTHQPPQPADCVIWRNATRRCANTQWPALGKLCISTGTAPKSYSGRVRQRTFPDACLLALNYRRRLNSRLFSTPHCFSPVPLITLFIEAPECCFIAV